MSRRDGDGSRGSPKAVGGSSITNMEAESINRTTIKKETLHPVWNETFDL